MKEGESVDIATEATPQGSPVAIEPTEETPGELRCEVDAAPQELVSTLELNVEDLFQFPIFLPKGARVTHSPQQREEEDFSIRMASNLKKRP